MSSVDPGRGLIADANADEAGKRASYVRDPAVMVWLTVIPLNLHLDIKLRLFAASEIDVLPDHFAVVDEVRLWMGIEQPRVPRQKILDVDVTKRAVTNVFDKDLVIDDAARIGVMITDLADVIGIEASMVYPAVSRRRHGQLAFAWSAAASSSAEASIGGKCPHREEQCGDRGRKDT